MAKLRVTKRPMTRQLTWGEFKRRVKVAGIKNSDPLWRVRLSYPQFEDNLKIKLTQLGVAID